MAAFTKSAVYDYAAVHFGIGDINWSTGETDILCCLCGDTNPTKTHEHYSDLAGELAEAGGYVQCTKAIAPATAHLASNVAHFESGDTTWTSATFTTYGGVLNHGVAKTAGNHLISYHYFGEAKTVVAGTLTLDWAATGCFTWTVAAEA